MTRLIVLAIVVATLSLIGCYPNPVGIGPNGMMALPLDDEGRLWIVTGSQPVYLADIQGRSLKCLHDVRLGYNPVLSPSGRMLAVADEGEPDQGILKICDLQHGSVTKAYVGEGMLSFLQWSPGGDEIAFVETIEPRRFREKPRTVLRLYTPSTKKVATLLRRAWATCAWMPDGRSIVAFERRQAAEFGEEYTDCSLVLVSVKSGRRIKLHRATVYSLTDIAVSGDGGSLLFAEVDRTGLTGQGTDEELPRRLRLVKYDLNTRKTADDFESPRPPVSPYCCEFSPDGRQIAYVAADLEAETGTLTVARADGRDPRSLLTAPDIWQIFWLSNTRLGCVLEENPPEDKPQEEEEEQPLEPIPGEVEAPSEEDKEQRRIAMPEIYPGRILTINSDGTDARDVSAAIAERFKALPKPGEVFEAITDGDVEKVRAILKADPSSVRARDELDFIEERNGELRTIIPGGTPLHAAASEGHKELVELLIANGAEVNAKDDDGKMPLHAAASAGAKEVVQVLLDKGAHAGAIDDYEGTPLHDAASGGSTEAVELLLSRGADIRAKDKGGDTPLHQAADYGHKEVVELLLAKGARPTVRNRDGKTPLGLALQRGHTEVADILRKHGKAK